MRKISVKPPQMKKEGGLRLQFQHGKFFRPNNYHRGISNQPTNRRSILGPAMIHVRQTLVISLVQFADGFGIADDGDAVPGLQRAVGGGDKGVVFAAN